MSTPHVFVYLAYSSVESAWSNRWYKAVSIMDAIPRAHGRMASVTMAGYSDSARHEPHELTRFFGMDLQEPLRLHGWTTRSVYITDMRLQNGTPPTTGYRIVEQAIPLLRLQARQAADLLLMEPDGLEGRPHAVGGGWSPMGSGVTFYIARNDTTDGSWRMRKFLCANVTAKWRELG